MLYAHTMEYYLTIKSTDACYNMNEPWKYYAKWKMPVTKVHKLHNSNLYKMPRTGKAIIIESWLPRARGDRGTWAVSAHGWRVSFWDNKNVLELDMVMVAQRGEYTKSHWLAHFTWVDCMISEYLNKAVIKINQQQSLPTEKWVKEMNRQFTKEIQEFDILYTEKKTCSTSLMAKEI